MVIFDQKWVVWCWLQNVFWVKTTSNCRFLGKIEQTIDLLFTEFISIPKINICNCFCHFASLWVNDSDDSMMVLVLECSPPPWFQQSQLFWNADSAKRTTWYAESDWPIFMTIPRDILPPCIKIGPIIFVKIHRIMWYFLFLTESSVIFSIQMNIWWLWQLQIKTFWNKWRMCPRIRIERILFS